MTYEKAIKILDTIPTIGEQVDALEMAIEALEKQMPKKPDFTDDYYDVAVCPCCHQYEFEYGTTTWQMAFCPNCGQSLNWEGIE